MRKDKYEISVWEDVVVAATDKVPAHFEEEKIGIIGSNTMTSQNRAIQPCLVNNVNGTSTLTFKLYYEYIDSRTGERVKNPWVGLLVNERKIKVLWKSKWYDMFVKSCVENSGDHTISYTCKDAFINELSKNGFNLEFDNELQNNTGTINELADRILEGTDWKRGPDTILDQKIEEPVYEVKVASTFSTDSGTSIPTDSAILVYYSVVVGREDYCQFWFGEPPYKTETNKQLVLNGECFAVSDVKWEETIRTVNSVQKTYLQAKKGTTLLFEIDKDANVSARYRANRLVRKQKTLIDSKLGRTVNVFTKDGKTYWGYTQTEFKDPTYVNNLIVNNENFASLTGWSGGELQFKLYPDWTKETSLSQSYIATSHLRFASNTNYLNRGIKNSSSFIPEGFQVGDKWVFRYRARASTADGLSPTGDYLTSGAIAAFIGKYSWTKTTIDGVEVYTYTPDGSNYFAINGSQSIQDNWIEQEYVCQKAITRSEIIREVNFGLLLSQASGAPIWIESFQFFPYILGNKYEAQENLTSFDSALTYYENIGGVYIETEDLTPKASKTYYLLSTSRINPGEMDMMSIGEVYYKYYDPAQNYNSADDIIYSYNGTQKQSDYEPYYGTSDNTYEKIRTITGKESNRFNLIQNLCETFECWAIFNTEHDQDTGRILYDENGCPKKTITFKEEIGERTGVGFVYGIDLKTIQRTINSDQIVSKTIVKPNSNEFAQDGFATIARAHNNYCRESFVLDFGYYISQGLLSSGQLTKDLYMTTPDAIGYYYYLNRWNTKYDENAERIAAKETELTKQEGFLTTYSNYRDSAQDQLNQLEADMMALSNTATIVAALEYAKENPDYQRLQSLVKTRFDVLQNVESFKAMAEKLDESVKNLKAQLEKWKKEQDELKEKIAAKHKEFWNKYSSYIQEGVWSSEDYVDDELYYLDACSIAYTSARPQISYDIQVLRLSALPEFRAKVFHLGDICFVQDTGFFGFQTIDGVKTPYKEEVFIAEITSYFDSPQNDSFKVQNYKTQFEDLFQRITATTQSLQYASGSYAKAAAIVNSDGTLKYETLQTAFARNENIIQAAQNETVIQDATGITLINQNNPNEMVKICSMGILLSIDGGITWRTGVRGTGISTENLTAGNINADNITILNGGMPQYRWDANGITAYWLQNGNLWLNKFIRHDQFGLYGVSNFEAKEDQPNIVFTSEDAIWNNDATRFALTWKGFLLKNSLGNGSIEINSEKNQILAKQKNDSGALTDRVILGRLDEAGNYYGLQIRNSDGAIAMETGSDGNLWLKNALKIGDGSTDSKVAIGNLGTVAGDVNGNRVFVAGGSNESPNFIVYENGKIVAQNAEIHGEIYATGGQIGGLTIETLPDTLGIRIVAEKGETFKKNGESVEPNELTFHIKTSIEGASTPTWYLGSTPEFSSTGTTGETFSISFATAATLFQNGLCYLKAEVSANGKTYSDTISLKMVENGEPGQAGTSAYVHIRYSANADGSNFTPSPTQETKYIGVYSGNSVTAPTAKEDYEWTEIKGADGKPGENAPAVKAQYSTDSTSWHDIFQNGDKWARFSYDDGATWTDPIRIAGEQGEAGQDANQFMVITGQEEILKFSSSVSDNGEITYKFSPSVLAIQLRDGRVSSKYEEADFDDENPAFLPGIVYYIKNGDVYVPVSGSASYDPSQTYYIKTPESYFLTDQYDIDLSYGATSIVDALGDKAWNYINCNPDDETSTIQKGEGTVYYFHIGKLYRDVLAASVSSYLALRSFINALNSADSCAIKITADLTTDGKYQECLKWISVKTGLNDDMARLSLEADGLFAAIQKAGFQFTANGLTITNGDFNIRHTDELGNVTTSLSYSNLDGTLRISGSLISGGTLSGVNGDFSGKITSSEGTIGGFEITDNSIVSKDRNLRLISNSETGESRIEVKNIALGEGATVEDMIRLGDLYLYNPAKHGGDAIIAYGTNAEGVKQPNFIVSQNGVITVQNECVMQSEPIPGTTPTQYYWRLSKDMAQFRNAYFNGNIEASTINATTIITQVFKALKTQAMGGSFIFRPSTREISISGQGNNVYEITINDDDFRKIAYPEKGEAILLQITSGGTTQKVKGYVTEDPTQVGGQVRTIKVKMDSALITTSPDAIDTMIYLGGSSKNNIIGVNSEDATGGVGSFLATRALSMSQLSYDLENNQWNTVKRLILGDLSASSGEIPALAGMGYGLYADNVYLNGRLITSGGNNDISAGFDSKSNIPLYQKEDDHPEDRIIMWAGAQGLTDLAIQQSPFIVTREGYIYATKGTFANGIIVNSTIEGAKISSAIIDGAGKQGEPSLIIYDTAEKANGVQFREWIHKGDYRQFTGTTFSSGTIYYEYDEVDGVYRETTDTAPSPGTVYYYLVPDSEKYKNTLAIASSGLYEESYSSTREPFIKLLQNASGGVQFTGKVFKTIDDEGHLKIEQKTLSFETSESETGTTIVFSKDQLALYEKLLIEKDLIHGKASQTWFDRDVRFGTQDDVRLEYVKDEEEGYSLFVY